jgi:hypothetical protein
MEAGNLLHGGCPQVVTHALWVGVVMVRIGAVGATDVVVVLVVHATLCVAILWFRVYIAVVSCSRRWKGLLGR